MGACARNMQSDSAKIKPAQCCIKLVFHLTNHHSAFSRNLGASTSWNPLGLSRPVMGRLYLLPETCRVTAEIKPAQYCIKLAFHLTCTMMHGSTKLRLAGNYLLIMKVTAACPTETLASTWKITLCPIRIRIYN